MVDSDKKSKLPPGVMPKAKSSGLGSEPLPPASEADSSQTVIAPESAELNAWRESLRPHLGGQRPGFLASGVDTIRNRESFKPIEAPRSLPRDGSETVAIADIARVSQTQRPKSVLPMRTWALLGITVLIAVYVFLLNDSDEPVTSSPAPKPSASQTVTSATPGGIDREGSSTDDSKPASAVTTKKAKARESDDTVDRDKETDDADSETDSATNAGVLEARAAAYWIRGDVLQALPLYKRLAQQYPDQPVFGVMVDILRRQMVETCQAGQDPC